MENAVVLSACRAPIGSLGGACRERPATGLAAAVIREAMVIDFSPAYSGRAA